MYVHFESILFPFCSNKKNMARFKIKIFDSALIHIYTKIAVHRAGIYRDAVIKIQLVLAGSLMVMVLVSRYRSSPSSPLLKCNGIVFNNKFPR